MPFRRKPCPDKNLARSFWEILYLATLLPGANSRNAVRDELTTTDPQLLGSMTQALAKSLDPILADKQVCSQILQMGVLGNLTLVELPV